MYWPRLRNSGVLLPFLWYASIVCAYTISLPYHALKMYVGVEVQPHVFLTSAVDGCSGQLHTLASLHYPPPAGIEPRYFGSATRNLVASGSLRIVGK